jgi:hypothetical protein
MDVKYISIIFASGLWWFFIQMDHLDRMGHRNPAAVDGPSGAGFTPREGSVPYGERCELVMG